MVSERAVEVVADVFISYKRDKRQSAERIASELRGLGLTVWFDAGLSAGTAPFNTNR